MNTETQMQPITRPIKTEEEYNEMLAHIDTLIDSEPGTPEKDYLSLISMLVYNYEQEHFSFGPLDPIEAIKYQMEELGVSTVEMATLVGGKSRLSELLNKKRELSINQIRAISNRLDIPVNILLPTA